MARYRIVQNNEGLFRIQQKRFLDGWSLPVKSDLWAGFRNFEEAEQRLKRTLFRPKVTLTVIKEYKF